MRQLIERSRIPVRRHCAVTLAAALMCIAPAAMGRAQPAEGRAALAAARTLQCTMALQSVGTWTLGEPQAEVKPIRMSLRFEDVDTDDGTARAIGSTGRNDVAARMVMDTLTFIQSGTDGSVALTTVAARPAPNGRWLAVHTRHEFSETSAAGITLGPVQYYGSCTIER